MEKKEKRKNEIKKNKRIEEKGPGITYVIPFVDKMMRVSNLRTVTMDVPPQDVITRDNVSIKEGPVSDPDADH